MLSILQIRKVGEHAYKVVKDVLTGNVPWVRGREHPENK